MNAFTLFFRLACLFSLFFAVQAFAQRDSPISAVATPSADELVGPIQVPGDSLDQMLALLERWSGRALLRPQNLPNL